MMRKTMMIMAAGMAMTATQAVASGHANSDEVTQVVTVDNQQVQKTVSEIQLDGNNARLLFTDGNSLTVDMQQVRLTLDYGDATGIGSLRLDGADGTQVYDIQGRRVSGNNIRKGGIYIVNGVKYRVNMLVEE